MADNGWFWGIAGSIGGTVLGALVLRGLGVAALDVRLKNLETLQATRHEELIRRLERLETLQMETK